MYEEFSPPTIEDLLSEREQVAVEILDWWERHELEHVEDEDGAPKFIAWAISIMNGPDTEH